MRITYVINGTDFGGTEMSLLRTALAMRDRGHAVAAVSLKPLGPLGLELAGAGVPVETLSMAERVSPADFGAGVLRLARVLRRLRPALVHAFLPRANVMSRIANRLAGRRPHVSGERSLNLQRSPLLTRANVLTMRWTDRVVAVSPVVAETLRARERVPEDKLRVIVNGIDVAALDRIAPADPRPACGLPPGTPLLCSVGRLHPVKGHVTLVRALARLRDDGIDVHCALAGDGPDADGVRALAAELGVADRLHLLGFRRDAVALMKTATALVLPSLEEGLPVTALEAMGARCPVIGSAVGGLLLAVRSGETGLLVPPGDPAALAGAIARMLTDPPFTAACIRAGRERVESAFTIDRMLDETERLYAELLAPAGPDPVPGPAAPVGAA